MRKIVSIIFIAVIGISFSFAKELEGKNLQAVKIVLEANLDANDFESLDDKISFLNKVENKITAYGNDISDEAKLICKTLLIKQKETAKTNDELKKEANQKKVSKKEKDPEKEQAAMEMFNQFKTFKENHEDLSSHFYYCFKQVEFATMPYLPVGKQLEILKTIVKDYEQIELMNPDYGENLFTYGMVLYMVPKIAGGDKEAGLTKIIKATEVSSTKYEKVSALMLYSQLMFEEKKYDESKEYLLKAKTLAPLNKSFDKIQEMNEAGFSFFKIDEYRKKKHSQEK